METEMSSAQGPETAGQCAATSESVHCVCDNCTSSAAERPPSPERHAYKQWTFRDLFYTETDKKYQDMFPDDVVLRMHRIRAQEQYDRARKNIADEMRALSMGPPTKKELMLARMRKRLADKKESQKI
jgi:hypothetical protein